MTKKFIVRFLICTSVVAALGLTGCTDKATAPVPAIQPPKATAPAAQVPQVEEPKAEKEVYAYDGKGRRDPFMSLIVNIKEKPQHRKKANPVENFDVDEIKLIAIVWEKNSYYAMITLPDGKSYTIRKGSVLGLNGGRVDDITKTSVRITEQVKNYKGQTVTKETILKLRQEGE
ncbi:MAG: pilus assembly protein PilP [Nitrospiraceae bacterium]|nr:pilus assembly protein PilP [Nitrospiraceae bacterium]